MTRLDRNIAGISCRQVLLGLSSFLDGELSPADEAAVRAHLAGCRECERFGGDVGRTIAALRTGAQRPPVLAADMGARLASRLRYETATE